jgi:hypothetical protein
MWRRLILALALAGIPLGIVPAVSAVPICLRTSMYCGGTPHLVPTLGGSVSPRKLSANEYAPTTWGLFGKFGTSDGAHLPALREVELDIDKDVKLNAKGYPVCRGGGRAIRNSNPRAAREACHAAILGEGEAHVEIAFPEQKPIVVKSPLTVFNGGEKGGEVKLLLHIFITVPVPAAVVTEVTVTRHGSGLHSVSKIPVIAGGSGSLVDFKFKLGKTYSYKGKKVGYVEAKCPDGVFKANVEKLLFKNEAHTPGEEAATQLKGALAVPCISQR